MVDVVPGLRISTEWPSGGKRVFTLGKRLAMGGEAGIFALKEERGLVAKIFHNRHTTSKNLLYKNQVRKEKLKIMVKYPPRSVLTRVEISGMAYEHILYAWPVALIIPKQDMHTLGYIMRKVDAIGTLFGLINPKLRRYKLPKANRQNLFQAALFLAFLVENIHNVPSGVNYVLVDLKPENVLLSPRGPALTLVDLDSIQVYHKGKLFPGSAFTTTYLPPEVMTPSFEVRADVRFTRDQESHMLAVILFQMLMQGRHPFASKMTSSEKEGSVHLRNLINCRFPYISKSNVSPPEGAEDDFNRLPSTIRELFISAFGPGCQKPSKRPSAALWYETLRNILEKGFE